ncbi:hypothetical protein C2E23DRAFT_798329, partial [Lenzites betulinus]
VRTGRQDNTSNGPQPRRRRHGRVAARAPTTRSSGCMGVKVSRRMYWPHSGVHCPDPELLEVSDNIVFGLHSELFKTDGGGSGQIVLGARAMVADRVVLLPETTVGKRLGRAGGTRRARPCASRTAGRTQTQTTAR